MRNLTSCNHHQFTFINFLAAVKHTINQYLQRQSKMHQPIRYVVANSGWIFQKLWLEGFSNFNIYSHSVQPYKYDRKQSNLPISIHFSIFNIRYIYLTHTSSMRRNETHKQLNIFETKHKWKNNSKATKIDTIESVNQS